MVSMADDCGWARKLTEDISGLKAACELVISMREEVLGQHAGCMLF